MSYGNAEHVKLLLKAGCSVTVTDLESMFQQTLDQSFFCIFPASGGKCEVNA